MDNYSLQNSYNQCHKIFKKHAKTYYFGALLFDHEKFLHVCAFYGLVRVVDDIIDLEKDEKKKIKNIEDFEKIFFNILNKPKKDREYLVTDESFWKDYHIILRAVINTTNIIGISKEIYKKFFKSMKMDLYKYEYKNYHELEEYMDGSAAIIGEVMLQIIKYKNNNPVYLDEKMTTYARDLGFAFQLTNFVRDIKEDMEMHPPRIYIPIDDQHKFNCQLQKFNINNNFKNLIEYQLKRCDKIYQNADKGILKIDTKYRYPILVSKILYSEINNRIRQKKYNIRTRISISKYEKFMILYNSLSVIQFIKVLFILFMNYIKYNFIFI